MATLTVSRLYKRFGSVEVLKGIELEAQTGEFIALVGPSGCAKSTLLAIIAGLETASEGKIRIDGRIVNSVARRDRDIGPSGGAFTHPRRRRRSPLVSLQRGSIAFPTTPTFARPGSAATMALSRITN